MKQNNSFTDYSASGVKGLVANFPQDFPTKLYAWDKTNPIYFDSREATILGFVFSGEMRLESLDFNYTLSAGMYFCVPLAEIGYLKISGGEGFLAERQDYRGFFQIGGKVEEQGRLKYIDGCTDSLLIPPVKLGDPCLNLLVFPPETNQTIHTHPSIRLGMVISGRGFCITPEEEIELYAGQVFCIHTDGLHAFRTEDEVMRVIAYHPDSDFGATDFNHPMLNRTIVEGVSAKHLNHILTK